MQQIEERKSEQHAPISINNRRLNETDMSIADELLEDEECMEEGESARNPFTKIMQEACAGVRDPSVH